MRKNLEKLAFKSKNTFGRSLPSNFDDDMFQYWMDPFSLDLNKIQYSNALARLRGKTSFVSGRRNIHIRDVLLHCMGVSTIAEQVALSLALNSILVRAGAMAHDLGRVAFGRIGEEFIAERLGEDFSHEKFAIFVLEIIERKGKGLNLSYETLRAIRNHSSWRPHLIKNGNPVEEDVLMLVDIWSNILSDYDDLHRIKIEKITLPDELMLLGDTQRNRINNCARALWLESRQKGMISFEESKEAINFKVVKEFMEQEIFPKIDRSDSLIILEKVYSFLEWYFSDSRSAALALALMSEEGVYVIGEMVGGYGNVFIKEKIDNIYSFAVAELLPFVPQWAELDFCNPDRFLDKNNFGKIPKEKCFAR